MKPGSSDRCTAKASTGLRCHLHKQHAGLHQAPRGKVTVYWNAAQPPVTA